MSTSSPFLTDFGHWKGKVLIYIFRMIWQSNTKITDNKIFFFTT